MQTSAFLSLSQREKEVVGMSSKQRSLSPQPPTQRYSSQGGLLSLCPVPYSASQNQTPTQSPAARLPLTFSELAQAMYLHRGEKDSSTLPEIYNQGQPLLTSFCSHSTPTGFRTITCCMGGEPQCLLLTTNIVLFCSYFPSWLWRFLKEEIPALC